MRVAFVFIPQFLYRSHAQSGGALAPFEDAEREPIVLVEGEGGRARVVAASNALRARGIRPRMTLSAVRSRVSEVRAFPFEPERVERESSRVAGVLLQASPHLHVAGQGAFWVGAHGWGLLGGEATLMTFLARLVQQEGYGQPQIGIADTVIAARAAAIVQSGIVLPGNDTAFLAPLPLAVLPIDTSTRESLLVLGIRTVGAFAALPARQIAARFSPPAIQAHRMAQGEDPRRLETVIPNERQGFEVDFDTPFEVVQPVLFVLQGGLTALLAPHAARGFGVRRLNLTLRLVGGHWEHEIRPADPANDPKILLDLCRAVLSEAVLDSMIEGVQVSLLEVAPAPARQEHLWAHRQRGGASLEVILTRLQSRLGLYAVRTPGPPRDAHLPEEAAEWSNVVSRPPTPFNGRSSELFAAWRLMNPPFNVLVQLVEGLPRQVRFQGRWCDVRRLGGPQRIETGWWEAPPASVENRGHSGSPGRGRDSPRRAEGDRPKNPWEDDKKPIRREYWYAELEDGPALSLYRDLGESGWYLQAVLD